MKVSQCPFMSLSLSFCYETHFALHWQLVQVATSEVDQNHYRDQCNSGQTTQSISRLPCCVFCTYMPVDNDNEVSRNRDYIYSVYIQAKKLSLGLLTQRTTRNITITMIKKCVKQVEIAKSGPLLNRSEYRKLTTSLESRLWMSWKGY